MISLSTDKIITQMSILMSVRQRAQTRPPTVAPYVIDTVHPIDTNH